MRIRPAGPGDLARVHQLIGRTNQFNLTSERLGTGEIEALIASPAHDLRLIEVDDRFGALGTVGLALVEEAGAGARLRLFLLSCRVIGRTVEVALMNAVKRDWLLSGRAVVLEAAFRPTPRNTPAADFLAARGFVPTHTDSDGTVHYRLDRRQARLESCPYIQVEETG